METRSNKIFVALVIAFFIAAMVAFILWMTAARRSNGRPYDIVITQSVSGLVAGSPVSYLGVPVGRVTSVGLDPSRSGAIRVRIDVTEDDLPIAQGTVARLNGDLLFGTALISLELASRSAPPLLALAGQEVPIIPLETGGMSSLANDPTPMVESIAYATDRLLAMTSPEQQRMMVERLQTMERSTSELAAQAPARAAAFARSRQALRDSAASSARIAEQADLARRNLDRRGRSSTRELRSSLAAARDSTRAIDQRLQAARPGVQGFSESLAGSPDQIAKARESLAAIREQVQQVERGGIGALTSSPPTPDYQPKNSR